MKKLFLLLIFLFSQKSYSQQYIPTLDSINYWSYESRCMAVAEALVPCNFNGWPGGPGGPFMDGTVGDTVIQSKLYKILTNQGVCTIGYLREDTAQKKIYFIDTQFNPEILLYDFSMQIGDTISIPFPNSSIHYSGVYRVDSIYNYPIASGLSRIFYLNGSNGGSTLIWIEGVGCPEHFVYPVNRIDGNWDFSACPGIQHLSDPFLTCFSHYHKAYFDTCAHSLSFGSAFMHFDSCSYTNYCSGINENISNLHFSVYPNPFQSAFTLKTDFSTNEYPLQLELLNVLGESVFNMEVYTKTVELSLTLSQGVYSCRMKSRVGQEFGKRLIKY